jgi:hypothetical protein
MSIASSHADDVHWYTSYVMAAGSLLLPARMSRVRAAVHLVLVASGFLAVAYAANGAATATACVNVCSIKPCLAASHALGCVCHRASRRPQAVLKSDPCWDKDCYPVRRSVLASQKFGAVMGKGSKLHANSNKF